MKPTRIFILWLIFGGLLMGSSALAQKLNFETGFYTLSANAPSGTESNNVKVSGLGVYSLSASFQIHPHLELAPGYTVFFSKVISGDMGFGPDFSLLYYPLNSGSGFKHESAKISYFEKEQLRPFLGVSFHQRQFQSIQSSYSGFGFSGGADYQLNPDFAIRGSLRTMSLIGPSSGNFSYFDVLVGLQLQFN